MAEQGGNEQDSKISRRRFLKLGLLGLGGAVVGSALSGCEGSSSKESKITHKEINHGEVIPLNISGGMAREITINYANSEIDHLQVRQRGGKDVTLAFRASEETTRLLGGITEPNLKKITGKNSSLGDEITVGVYPKLTGNLLGVGGREDLMNSDRLYGLSVIVANVSYMEDEAPAEINKNAKFREGSSNIGEFGDGLAVGILEEDKFIIIGYVSDSRAVEIE